MIKEYLIDMSDITYDDYKSIYSYIDEAFIIPDMKQDNEVKRTLDKLKKVNKNLDDYKFDDETEESMKEVLEELKDHAETIRKKNITIYTSIAIASEVIKYTYKIISFYKFINDSVLPIFKKGPGGTSKLNPSNFDPRDYNIKPGDGKVKVFLKIFFSKKTIKEIAGKMFTMDTLKGMLKEMFSLKTLIITILSVMNSYLHAFACRYISYEKAIDKTYEMLLECEARMMKEKREAKKNNDKYLEESCDKIIEFIETKKKEHVKEKMAVQKANESTVLSEVYKGNEYKINTLKLVCRDIREALEIEISNLDTYCNTAIYILRRALEINEDNKETKIKAIEDKIEKTKNYVNDADRQYDKSSLDALLSKYISMFSTKYSTFGLAAREKFEKRLEEFAKRIGEIYENYKQNLTNILREKSFNLNAMIDKLNSKVTNKSSIRTSNEVRRLFLEVNEDSARTVEFCNNYIRWCKKQLSLKEVKYSLTNLVLNKLFA